MTRSHVRGMCDRCLERVQSQDYERRGRKWDNVQRCCGRPRNMSIDELRLVASMEQKKRGGKPQTARVRQTVQREERTSGMMRWMLNNPEVAGVAMGLGLVVLSSVGSGGDGAGMSGGESGMDGSTGDTSLEESGGMVSCPECGCEVSKSGFVGHCQFSDDHDLTGAQAGEMLKELRDDEENE